MSRKPFACFALVLALSGCASTSDVNQEGRRITSPEERAKLVLASANASLLDNDPIGALEKFSQAEQLKANPAEIAHGRAIAHAIRRELAQALPFAHQAVKLKPESSSYRNTLGKLLLDAGRAAEARPHLEQAARDPLNRDAWKANSNLGILHYRRGEFRESARALDQAIEQGKGIACLAHYYRGHLRLREANFEKAVRDYERATQQICGSFAEAHLAVGVALERGGQLDRARKKFLDVQRNFPESPVADQAVQRLRKLP